MELPLRRIDLVQAGQLRAKGQTVVATIMENIVFSKVPSVSKALETTHRSAVQTVSEALNLILNADFSKMANK